VAARDVDVGPSWRNVGQTGFDHRIPTFPIVHRFCNYTFGRDVSRYSERGCCHGDRSFTRVNHADGLNIDAYATQQGIVMQGGSGQGGIRCRRPSSAVSVWGRAWAIADGEHIELIAETLLKVTACASVDICNC